MNSLHHIKFFHTITAFLAVLMLAGAPVSYAQNYTLTVRDGQVYVNGKLLPRDEVPASLDVKSLDAHLSFPGPSVPTFELNGSYYKIENDRLIDVTPDARRGDRTTVIFRNAPQPAESEAAAASGVRSEYPSPGDVRSYSNRENNVYSYDAEDLDDPNVVMQQYVFELNQNARQLNEMRSSLSQRQAQDLIQRVQLQAEQAAQLAQELPYLEMQNYFSAVRESDERLYQRLLNELELERETQRLAAEISRMPEGNARESRVRELRELLGRILDLKQENRRLEIEQLEKQLKLLKERFSDREEMKQRLIDRRVEELLQGQR